MKLIMKYGGFNMKFAIKSIMKSAVKSVMKSAVKYMTSIVKSAVKSVMNLMKSYKILLLLVKSCLILRNPLKSLDFDKSCCV